MGPTRTDKFENTMLPMVVNPAKRTIGLKKVGYIGMSDFTVMGAPIAVSLGVMCPTESTLDYEKSHIVRTPSGAIIDMSDTIGIAMGSPLASAILREVKEVVSLPHGE